MKNICNSTRKIVKARLYWVSKKDGGRETMIIGEDLLYCPIIRLEDYISNMSWSCKITKSIFVDELITDVDLTFLVDSAPFEQLQSNRKFDLYEGLTLVARGVIL